MASTIASLLEPGISMRFPRWLWPEQRDIVARAAAALDIFGTALIAEPPGSGKTFMALALATMRNAAVATCLGPAAAAGQWQDAARATGVTLNFLSHESVSRGRAPGTAGLLVIDESHRFRDPHTKRYGIAADWLLGREALLLSATPIINRIDDLRHQLRLAMRGNAGRAAGMPSLASLHNATDWPEAMRRVIIRSRGRARLPTIARRTERPPLSRPMARAVAALHKLRLSRSIPVAAILRSVLCRAAASSPAALDASLRRYQLLLLNARDAEADGRHLSRNRLRALAGDFVEQTVLWPLLDSGDCDAGLVTDDLAPVRRLRRRLRDACQADDPRLLRLEQLLADGRCTIVFTTFRATLDWLRKRLPYQAAWCSGSSAGIGRSRCPRDVVLGLFDAGRSSSDPVILLTTDVSAESLNLHRAERIIHFDLPWTQAKIEQREGRSARAGSRHPVTESVRFDPSEKLEHHIHLVSAISRKAAVTSAATHAMESAATRSRDHSFRASRPSSGVAVVIDGGEPGILAAVAVQSPRQSIVRALWLTPDGRSEEATGAIDSALERARGVSGSAHSAEQDELAPVRLLLRRIASDLRGVHDVPLGHTERRVVHRLTKALVASSRQRDLALARACTVGIQLVQSMRTAGSERLAAILDRASDGELLERVRSLPGTDPGTHVSVSLAAVIIYRSRQALLR